MGERDNSKETVSSADVHVQKRILLFTMVYRFRGSLLYGIARSLGF